MLFKIPGLAVLALCLATAPALAQAPKAEVGVLLGWTFADGASGNPIKALDGNTYNRADPKDSFSWGLDVGVFAGPNLQVGFLFGQQMSTLTVGGTKTTEIGDMTVNTYHPYVAYNLGESDAHVRPYLSLGLGATQYSSVDFTRANGTAATVAGETQFSTTWGAGVKIYPNPKVGLRMGVQWTPTYIKSDYAGTWCDPYWGCYVLSDAQYANQWQFNGGLTFRF